MTQGTTTWEQTKSKERQVPSAMGIGKPRFATVRYMVLRCGNCEHEQEVRADSFLPGAHVLICGNCFHAGSEVKLLDGSVHAVTAKAHTGGGV